LHKRSIILFSLYLAIVYCLFSFSALAQPPMPYHSRVFGPKDGLPSADIFSVTQDHLSNLWIGHSMGCTKYNGSTMDQFIYASNKPIGTVYSFMEDTDYRLWVGAENGLYYLDRDSLVSINFVNLKTPVYDISRDNENNFWIGTGIGPIKIPKEKMQDILDSKSVDITMYLLKEWHQTNLMQQKVIKIIHAAHDVHFFSTYNEIVMWKEKHLSKIWSTQNPVDYCNSLAFMDDSLFISCSVSGLMIYDGKTLFPMKKSYMYGYSLLKKDNHIFYVARDEIYLINPSSMDISLVAHIETKYIRWIKELWVDHENNFWLASNEGLIYLKPELFVNYSSKIDAPENEIYSLFQTHTGEILAGSNHGVLFELNKNGFKSYSKLPHIFPRAEIFSIQEDADKSLWFSSGYEGLARFRNNHLEFYTIKDGLRDNTNNFFLLTHSGRLYTGGDKGLSEIVSDSSTGKVYFRNFIYKSETSTNSHFNTAIDDKSGNIWVGSEFGLFRLKNDTLVKIKIQNSDISDFVITDIKIDKNGDLWLATMGNGVLVCSINKDHIPVLRHHLFTTGKFNGTGFLSVLIDKENNIWLATYQGIIRMEPGTFIFRYYDAGSGFLNSSFKYIKLLQSTDGSIWAASSYGTVSLDPANFSKKEFLRPVHISKVIQHDSLLFFGRNEINKKYQFSYSRYPITIHFEEILFSNPSAVNFQYRLLNVDTSWINIYTASSVILPTLNPGHYTFEVRASAGDNQWTIPSTFNFEITGPFWLNPFFIAFVILCLFGFGYFLLKRRVASIKKEEARKTELQTIKTDSLRLQLEIEKVTSYFTSLISEKKTLEEILWDVAKNCIAKLGFEDCVIYLVDNEKKVLVQKAAWGPKTTEENRIINPMEIPLGKGIVGTVAKTGKGEIINDTSLDSRYIVDDARRYSEICVPMLDNGQVTGVIDSEHAEKGFYTGMHFQILSTIATLCTDKIKKVEIENLAREKEIEVIKLNRDLAASQLTALRSQMNPHFIFNALNSIQQYILTGNVDDANKYLSKFSRLQREILNQSDKHFISLEKEIEMLTLYLQLEQLRFEDGFEYEIKIHDDLDVSEIKIPPMIMQPFVENSIWHGLMSQKTHKKILIEFDSQNEDVLIAKIIDNGIGRAASAKLKEQSTSKIHYPSRGFSLIKERLHILQQQYNKPFGAAISDITDKDGTILGTEVTLSIYIL